MEEYNNKVNITIDNSHNIVDWNYYGLYDIKKLFPEHFISIKAIEFFDRFNMTIQSEIGIKKKHIEV